MLYKTESQSPLYQSFYLLNQTCPLMLIASDKSSDVLLLSIHPLIHHLLNTFFVQDTTQDFVYSVSCNPQNNPLGWLVLSPFYRQGILGSGTRHLWAESLSFSVPPLHPQKTEPTFIGPGLWKLFLDRTLLLFSLLIGIIHEHVIQAEPIRFFLLEIWNWNSKTASPCLWLEHIE